MNLEKKKKKWQVRNCKPTQNLSNKNISQRVSFFSRLKECQSQTQTPPQHTSTTTITKPTAQNLTEKESGKKKRSRNSPEKQLVFWVLRHVHKISEGKNTQTYSNINISTTSRCRDEHMTSVCCNGTPGKHQIRT